MLHQSSPGGCQQLSNRPVPAFTTVRWPAAGVHVFHIPTAELFANEVDIAEVLHELACCCIACGDAHMLYKVCRVFRLHAHFDFHV